MDDLVKKIQELQNQLAQVRRALKYVLEVRAIKCLHEPPDLDEICAKCSADKALSLVNSDG